MEQEKYKRAIEIAHELDMLNEVIGELNNPIRTATLRFCWVWNSQAHSEQWKPCDNMDCISEILARHTVMVLHEIQERQKQLLKEIEEL